MDFVIGAYMKFPLLTIRLTNRGRAVLGEYRSSSLLLPLILLIFRINAITNINSRFC